MLLNKENFDIWYEEYREQYKRTTKYVKSRKGKVRDVTPMTRSEFEIDFRSMVADNPKKSGKQIAQKMAKQELYTTTYEQARRYAEAHVEALGGEVTPYLIQQYRMEANGDLFTMISATRKQMKHDGFSNSIIQMFISQEFFGSE